MVYRVSEASIRRALDTGRTASTLHTFFTKHSKTPVPQGLTYLIDDAARRHGQLRVGIARSFVRCEDPALLAQVVSASMTADLELRLLAPTVAVSQAPIADVLNGLREAGFAPAAEDSSGAIVDLRSRGARVAVAPHRRVPRPTPPSGQNLHAIVSVLRKVAATPHTMRVDPGTAILLLQQAAREDAADAAVRYYLGMALYRLEQWGRAEEELRLSDRLDPTDFRALALLCVLQRDAGRGDEASISRTMLEQRFSARHAEFDAACPP
jgi:hypothetical protein